MFTYLFISVIIISGGISSLLSKKFQLGVKNNLATMVLLNFVNAVFGTVYFFFICKFRIQMNFTTFIYSVLYAGLVVNSMIINVVALSRMSIPLYSIVGMSGNVFGSAVLGIIFFSEKITIGSFVAVILMIVAVVLPSIRELKFSIKKTSLWISIWVFVTSMTSSTFLKFYTESPKALNANNLFFMTNFICLIVFAMFIVLYGIIKGVNAAKFTFCRVLKPGQILNIGARTALSNVISILSVVVIAAMDISKYTIITSSLNLILGAGISKLIFKENLSKETYVSILLAIFAIIIRNM